jgi:hypothetical protein
MLSNITWGFIIQKQPVFQLYDYIKVLVLKSTTAQRWNIVIR